MTYAHGLSVPQPGIKPRFDATPAIAPKNRVEAAIARASAKTGVDFSFLVDKANVESSMNPSAKSKNSTATGLYQFIEKTWLSMVRKHGEKYGLDKYAQCIDENCHVSDPRMRQKILDLRKDPETAACMAAEYATENAQILEDRVGNITPIGNTELYLAHFLGAGGASKFLDAMHKNPDMRGTQLFPTEARANRGVFFNYETGRARTLNEIYQFFDQKFGSEPSNELAQVLNSIEPETGTTTIKSAAAEKNYAFGIIKNDPCTEVAETPITLTRAMIDELLATPPRRFGDDPAATQLTERRTARNTTTPASVLASGTHQQRQLTSMAQSELLVVAQSFLHDNQSRYNS